MAEAKTDDLISEAPKPALDQSGEWQETSGEIQWVASETNESQPEKKEEEDEELDLNKGRCWSGLLHCDVNGDILSTCDWFTACDCDHVTGS